MRLFARQTVVSVIGLIGLIGLLTLAGCSIGKDTQTFTIKDPENGKQQVSVSTDKGNDSVTLKVGEGEDAITMNMNQDKDAILAALPKKFPLPDDYLIIEDQSSTLKSEEGLQVNVSYLTNTDNEEIFDMYKAFLKDWGSFSITETAELDNLIAFSEKDMMYVMLTQVSDSGYSTQVMVNVITQTGAQ